MKPFYLSKRRCFIYQNKVILIMLKLCTDCLKRCSFAYRNDVVLIWLIFFDFLSFLKSLYHKRKARIKQNPHPSLSLEARSTTTASLQSAASIFPAPSRSTSHCSAGDSSSVDLVEDLNRKVS